MRNTNQKKIIRNYGGMGEKTIEESLKTVFEQSDNNTLILGYFFNSGVRTVFGFKYDTSEYGYVESMRWDCEEHYYLVCSEGKYIFKNA